MQTVLLAAGDGESIEPLSSSTPKPLLPVGGEPLLSHAARRAVAAGATELVVVVPPYYQPFANALGDAVDDVPVEYAIQPRPMGTANALVVARRHLDEDFVVLPGDTLFDPDDLSSLYANVPCVGVSARDENADGQVVVGDGGPLDVTTLGDDETGPYVDASACSLPAEAKNWTRLPPNDAGERDITGVVERTADGHDLRPVLLGEYVDVDHAWDLLDANQHVLDEWAASVDGPVVEGDVADQSRVHGSVRVEENATVSYGAVVEGPSIVAEGATIEPNAYVRPYSYVGRDVTVSHGVEVSNSILLAGTEIGSLSYVADSIVGRNVTFGAGTKVSNLDPDGDHVVADVSGGPRTTERERFGVVVGEGASTGVDTCLEAGVVLPRYATTDPGETVRAETEDAEASSTDTERTDANHVDAK